MKISDFDYDLPPECIAQRPPAERSDSRMLVLGRRTGKACPDRFSSFPGYLRPGDCLVLNDTRVMAARLFGRREPSGGRVEAFLLAAEADGRWQCMLRPGRRLRPGDRVRLEQEDASFTVAARHGDGSFSIAFDVADVPALIDRAGAVPLPPYIRREADAEDRERYQTVYAARPGAVAAPTAGLHFTRDMLAAVEAAGVALARVTLHVGAGTFKPVTADRPEDHVMHEEAYELSPTAAETINGARSRGGRIVAVGTTSVRVLETCADRATGRVIPGVGTTRLFMHPPTEPAATDALLTNFHLPRSTLLLLVSCFCPADHVLAAYRLAIREGFRFYSYGDCMLLLPE